MSHIVEVPLQGGGVVYIESDTFPGESPIVPAGKRADEAIVRASKTLEDSLEGICNAAEAMVTKLRSLTKAPSELTVEFAAKFSVKSGFIIAEGAAEGTVKVSLKWESS